MSRRLKSILFALALGLALPTFAPTTAQAEELSISALSDDARAELGQLFSTAQRAFEAANYPDAIASLEAAFEIFPEPNILYRIGDAYERQGLLAEAITYYTRYIEADADADDVPMVHRHISELQQFIQKDTPSEPPPKPAELKSAVLFIDSTPPGAHVYIGDEPAPRGMTPTRIRVSPGKTSILINHPGRQPITRVLGVEAGETLSMVYPLQALPAADAPPTEAPSSAWPWVIGGVGAASLATGAGLLLAASDARTQLDAYDKQRLDAHQSGDVVPRRPADYDQLKSDEYYFRRSGWALVGIGAAGVGAGIIWLTSSDSDDAQVAVVPAWGGASVVGRF